MTPLISTSRNQCFIWAILDTVALFASSGYLDGTATWVDGYIHKQPRTASLCLNLSTLLLAFCSL